jgi:hypothetical protein
MPLSALVIRGSSRTRSREPNRLRAAPPRPATVLAGGQLEQETESSGGASDPAPQHNAGTSFAVAWNPVTVT